MDSSDLERELSQLWRRVRDDEPAAEPAPDPLSAGPFAVRRYETELAELREALEAREKSAASLTQRLAASEAELAKLKLKFDREQDLFLKQLLQASTALEQAQRAIRSASEDRRREEAAQHKRRQDELAALRRAHAEELASVKRALETALAKARAEAEDEKKRSDQLHAYWKNLEKKWHEREARLLHKTSSAEAEAKRSAAAFEAAQTEARRSAEKAAASASEAAERTEQLSAQKRAAAEAREALSAASAKVAELEARLKDQQAAFDEERRQWREMWDREHHAWETQRQEFEVWEEKLRREREAWLESMRAKEAEEVQAAERLAEVLKTTTSLVSSRPAAGAGPAGTGADFASRSRSMSLSLTWAAALAGAALLSWAGVWAFGHTHLRLESESSLALKRPTALAASSDAVWIAQWDGGLVQAPASDPSRPSRRFELPAPAHPLSLPWSKEALWALDAATAGLLRLDPADPSKAPERTAPAAAVATAAASDGRELWTFDGAARVFWRQGLGGGAARSLPAPEGLWPSSLSASGGQLWAYDAKSGDLWRLEPGDSQLKTAERFALPGRPLAAAAAGRELWTLSAAGADRYELRRYRLWP